LGVVLASASSGVHPWGAGTAAAGLVVTTAADDTNDDGDCSLREALTNANDNALTHDDCLVAGVDAGDEISFALPANSTIVLTDGPLAIEDDVVIDGSAVPGLTISGNNATRVFAIGQTNSGFAVTISDLRITDAFLNTGDGGAVL